MTGELKRVSLRYRTLDMVCYGTWYGDDGSFYMRTAFATNPEESQTVNCWPLVEDTPVGEELTAACAQKLIDEEAVAAREAAAAVGRE